MPVLSHSFGILLRSIMDLGSVLHRPTHIYSRYRIPPDHVVSNHIDNDKLTTANGGTLRRSRAQPVSVANHVKARQSLIERVAT